MIEMEIEFTNGKIMDISFEYRDAFDGGEYDLECDMKVVHNSLIQYIKKYGIDVDLFSYSLLDALRVTYGETISPYQEIHCKIGNDRFTIYALFCKLKSETTSRKLPFDMILGIKETLSEEQKRDLAHIRRLAQTL